MPRELCRGVTCNAPTKPGNKHILSSMNQLRTKPITDDEFEAKFADSSLKPVYFKHHLGHLRLTWIHISKYGVDQAIENICRQIRAYDKTWGNGDKYDHTLTIAAVKLVGEYMDRNPGTNVESFVETWPELSTDFIPLLKARFGDDLSGALAE